MNDDRDLVQILLDKAFKDILSSKEVDDLVSSISSQPPRLYCQFDNQISIDVNHSTASVLANEQQDQSSKQREQHSDEEDEERELMHLEDHSYEEEHQELSEQSKAEDRIAEGLGNRNHQEEMHEASGEDIHHEDEERFDEEQLEEGRDVEFDEEETDPEMQFIKKETEDENVSEQLNEEGSDLKNASSIIPLPHTEHVPFPINKVIQRQEFKEGAESIFEDIFLEVINEVTSGKLEIRNYHNSLKRSMTKINTVNRLSSLRNIRNGN